MHVNKIPLLPSTVLRWLGLRNEIFRSCLVTTRSISDSNLVRSVDGDSLVRASTSILTLPNPSNRRHSRYCASTIMRPHSKTFSFKDYDIIGFDLDGTALRYNLAEMIPLEFELLSRYLVERKGYSTRLLRRLDNCADKDFLQKGLFLDADKGNILKLNSDGCILRANHGTRRLTDDEVAAAYGEERKWSVTSQFIEDPLCAWNGPLSEKMRGLLDYFDISAGLVFANAVDDVDDRRQLDGDNCQPYKVWPDILEALICIYTRENFANGKSEYFKKLRSDPDRYLLKTSPSVIKWLKELKASNKIVYLLTGSHIDFANFTATYAMGENWRDLFDVVICFARKPGFFHASRQFHNIDGFTEGDPIPIGDELKMNSVYSMGNWQQLLKSFAQKRGKAISEMRSLYVGDNLIQDVYAPDALANIDSVAVSEEMLAENSVDNCYDPEKFVYRDVVASSYWNSYFFEDGEPTLWTGIIDKYSKMCVPSLEHIAKKPVDHQFNMCNEQGFYPSSPIVEQ